MFLPLPRSSAGQEKGKASGSHGKRKKERQGGLDFRRQLTSVFFLSLNFSTSRIFKINPTAHTTRVYLLPMSFAEFIDEAPILPASKAFVSSYAQRISVSFTTFGYVQITFLLTCP
jgi:hypothetical protein